MKKEYIEKERKRISQQIKLLTFNPDFQKDVLKLRRRWNVPKNGIKTEKHNKQLK